LPDRVTDVVIFSADGQPWFSYDETRRHADLDAISRNLRRAVVAIEDRRFYGHLGVDPVAIGRAVSRDVRERRLVEGGSTLTQQLARILFLSNERTFRRKLEEAVLALILETRFTKQQILEWYLNNVYLGAGIYGVEGMARHLFDKPSADLTLDEAALIVGLIRAPSALSPWSHPDAALRQRNRVLDRLRSEGIIGADEADAAIRAPLDVGRYPLVDRVRGAYAKDFIRQQLGRGRKGEGPASRAVMTTIVPDLQQAAEAAVARGLRRVEDTNLQAALVAIEPHTGNLLAMVGGRDFARAPFNRAVRSRRQPASAFKPFVFAAALERGFSPISILSNLTTFVPVSDDGWVPINAEGQDEDQVTLRTALLESNNRAAVALQQRIGTNSVVTLATNLGISKLPSVPSLALGTGAVSPLELTAAFAAFANGGIAVRPRVIDRVTDDGRSVAEPAPVRRHVMSEQTAFQMASMLADVMDRGTGAPARALGITFPIAGKTGTSDEFKDAWFVGFSSAVVVGVWVGFDRPATIDVDAYGSRLALPIWTDFMLSTAARLPPKPFVAPTGLREVVLCRESYLRPTKACPTYREFVKDDDVIPDQKCVGGHIEREPNIP
jgi:1A family penicillin-binding protein